MLTIMLTTKDYITQRSPHT
ncbi:unnamed protein product [Timema podura]|uniref:Uncharacterized protein n=1 Tax=Timema podura TaxID=61482 RepID=A0ABN7PMQ5_TIMPD|nr:unnamed protein product [Timema podura]